METFVEPVGVTFFGGIGLEEGENITGNVCHHVRVKLWVLQVRNVLRFYQLILLLMSKITNEFPNYITMLEIQQFVSSHVRGIIIIRAGKSLYLQIR